MKYLLLLALISVSAHSDTDLTSTVGITGHYEQTDGNYEYIPNSSRVVYTGYMGSDSSRLTSSLILDNENNPIEEAWVEYAIPIKQKSNVYLSVGTADVLYGFYNNGLDVITTGSSTLPQGVYSYDFVKGGFSRVYGLSAEFENTLDNYNVTYHIKYSKGKALVDSEFLLESSLFGGVDSADVDVSHNTGEILSFSINYKDRVELFALRSKHDFQLDNVTGSPIKDIPTYLASTPNYGFDINRVGIKLSLDYQIEITAEHFTLDVITTNPVAKGSDGGYITVQQFYKDYSFTVGRSKAQSYRAGSDINTDEFIGISYWGDKVTVGLEVHQGNGSAWLTTNKGKVSDWNSAIITFGVTL